MRRTFSDKSKKVNAGRKDSQGAFSRVFTSQQTKVNSKKEVSDLLTHFAEEDLKRIAVMIQKWLDKDLKEKSVGTVNKSNRR